MSSLTEALSSAKKELESQSIRLRDLETLLSEERRAREDAEERANRLERKSTKEPEEPELALANRNIHKSETGKGEGDNAPELENGSASPGGADESAARLQQRLDLMMSEMNEMKQQMERYRERAETAEADRQSLAEMIETIRKENAKTAGKEARRRSRSNSQLARTGADIGTDASENYDDAEEGEITIIKEKDLDEDGPEASLPEASTQNGHAVEHNDVSQSAKTSNALATRRPDRDAMYYGGPAGAVFAVVAIGVAVMTMLNQYPKSER
jgi:hypothetical protein